MKLNLGGITQISTIDWYGKVAMVIYLRKCTFKCKYCQNYALLEGDNYVDIEIVEEEIEKARDFIDAIVYSGGEPSLQLPPLEKLSAKARQFGLKIAIETNGSLPENINKLCIDKKIDAVFLDVKAPLSNVDLYRDITGVASVGTIEKIKRTIEICRNSEVEFEVRTTVFKGLNDNKEQIIEIAKAISGCNCYAIQQGRPELAWSEEIKRSSPLSREELIELAKAAKQYLKEVRIRTKEKGNEKIE
ncbi:MAG: anaerobic ribonucleoside-triphosphate reductase activating protein [Methanocellales archaeon]